MAMYDDLDLLPDFPAGSAVGPSALATTPPPVSLSSSSSSSVSESVVQAVPRPQLLDFLSGQFAALAGMDPVKAALMAVAKLTEPTPLEDTATFQFTLPPASPFQGEEKIRPLDQTRQTSSSSSSLSNSLRAQQWRAEAEWRQKWEEAEEAHSISAGLLGWRLDLLGLPGYVALDFPLAQTSLRLDFASAGAEGKVLVSLGSKQQKKEEGENAVQFAEFQKALVESLQIFQQLKAHADEGFEVKLLPFIVQCADLALGRANDFWRELTPFLSAAGNLKITPSVNKEGLPVLHMTGSSQTRSITKMELELKVVGVEKYPFMDISLSVEELRMTGRSGKSASVEEEFVVRKELQKMVDQFAPPKSTYGRLTALCEALSSKFFV
jgi:hypothetical protein